jgi:FixJ family two-component response regulator
MTTQAPTVFIVDDDTGVLRALSRLVSAAGYCVQTFASPREFLSLHDPSLPGCAVIDMSMPDLDGLALQSAFSVGGVDRMIIFITGHGDIKKTVTAMKKGAVDFLTKPVKANELLEAIGKAIEKDAELRNTRVALSLINARLTQLTPREHEVMTHVVAGRLNKQIAGDLGTVEKTIKVHRSRMMAKMGVRNLAQLVRIADRAGIRPAV